jgi:hypothetical protein
MRNWFTGCVAAAFTILFLAAPTAADDRNAVIYTPEQVDIFADLLISAAAIETARYEGAQSAKTDAEAQSITEAADAELVREIETSGLAIADFDAMVEQVQTDIRLSIQVTDALARRGAIPAEFPGEGATAETVFGSGAVLTRHALEGEAGF